MHKERNAANGHGVMEWVSYLERKNQAMEGQSVKN